MKSARKKEAYGSSTAMISSLRRSKRNFSSKDMDEISDDEIQLCQVRSAEGSPERHTAQRAHASRMYHQSPQRLSSLSRNPSDSWQDASTEPLVPQTPNQNAVSKGKDNDITLPRKANDSLDTNEQTKELSQSQDSQEVRNAYLRKKLLLQSSQQISASSSRPPSDSWQDEAPTEPLAPLDTAHENEFSIPKAHETPTVLRKRKADTPLDPEALTKALRRTEENASIASQAKTDDDTSAEKKEVNNQETSKAIGGSQDQKQSINDKAAEPEQCMGPPSSQQQGNKKPTKEEEEARIAQEIDYLMKTVKCLPNYYKLVDKIGEGTFSTVYKAQDIRRDYYDNNEWEPQLLESAQTSYVSPSSTPTRPTASTDQARGKSSQSPPSSPKDLSEFVALKRVYDTSSPRRIANEIKILRRLKGSKCISPIITAFRQQDQVFVVMPYIQHDDFKSSFHKMELIDIKYYMKSLFTALEQLHKFRILHRDVKPNNFLYNIRKRAGYLIDFGLAESEDDVKMLEMHIEKAAKASKFSVYSQAHHHQTNTHSSAAHNNSLNTKSIAKIASSNSVLAALTNKENRAGLPPTTSTSISSTTSTSTSTSTSASSSATTSTTTPLAFTVSRQSNRIIKGYIRNDPRLSIRANRAGTRGFRAPEILMRVTHQTCAIDIWAAGVILLCFLTNTYPFFLSNDEADALIELGQIYGLERLQECARINNRHFETNVNIPKTKLPWNTLIEILNKEKVSSWSRRDYDGAVDLLRRSLELDPNKRITAEEALKMDFLQVD